MFGGRLNHLTATLIRRIRAKFLAQITGVNMDYMEIVKEIMQDAFDPWCFNKLEKQYMGNFDEEECLRILQKHFTQGAKNTEQQVQADPTDSLTQCSVDALRCNCVTPTTRQVFGTDYRRKK